MKSYPFYFKTLLPFKTKEEIEYYYRNKPGKLTTITEIYNEYSIFTDNYIKHFNTKISFYKFYFNKKMIKRLNSV